ncbi:MAG: class B sortase [Clostridia bacterium]|nr:class B sortase [Clostridia bacterium]MBQ9989318.1 class B sortase [Clostridia bacterium]
MGLFFVLMGLYAVYALVDNSRVYEKAEHVQAGMAQLKPDAAGPNREKEFAELKAVNPDICAWLTLDNTGVDHPVVQGKTNLTYINTDVYGEFALSGSIYLDSRNDPNFSDAYAVVYGHHMENGSMFGDLDLYLDPVFFRENNTGELLLADRVYDLKILACLTVSASDSVIFAPFAGADKIDRLVSYARKKAAHVQDDALSALTRDAQIIALTTCSSAFTDARTIVLAAMEQKER